MSCKELDLYIKREKEKNNMEIFEKDKNKLVDGKVVEIKLKNTTCNRS